MSAGFGPSPVHWSEGGPDGQRVTKIVNLANVGQGDLTDLHLLGAGEHTPNMIPLETPGGERIGDVQNVHYSNERQALMCEITSSYAYLDHQLTTEFTNDRSRVIRVVLVK